MFWLRIQFVNVLIYGNLIRSLIHWHILYHTFLGYINEENHAYAIDDNISVILFEMIFSEYIIEANYICVTSDLWTSIWKHFGIDI